MISDHPSKEEYIKAAKDCAYEWHKIGYKTADNFIAEVSEMDDKLFAEWFDLCPGDKFLANPGNSWGHPKTMELIFKGFGDSFFEGDKHIGYFETDYMEWCFMSSFKGILAVL